MIAHSARVDYHGGMQDTVRKTLLSYGQQEVNVTVDDLVGKTGLSYPQVYQTLYRLQRNNEIEIIKEDDSSPRSRVVGVKLIKMAPIEEITSRIGERETETIASRDVTQMTMNVPHVLEYINQRIAVEKAKEELAKANIDPDGVISFSPDPIGEEAIVLLQQLQAKVQENRMLKNDVEAEKRNVEHLKNQMTAVRTFSDSGT